jgi:hypothetical protein
VGAIVYFEKTLEDSEHVTYRYGTEEEEFAHAVVISKSNMLPVDVDPEKASVGVELAFNGIIKGYRRQGKWPERGAGYA